jgi:biopolymer transport protein TolQ
MHNMIPTHLVTLQRGSGGGEQLDPLQLMLDASPVVKLVLLLLIAMFFGCLFIMGAKFIQLMQAKRQSNQFLNLFWGSDQSPHWSPERLEAVYAQLRSYRGSPLATVFRAGYVELARMAHDPGAQGHQAGSQGGDLENIERAVKRAAGHEMTGLETMLPFLATTGSTAPFVGLFGTVWGIMHTFLSLHDAQGEGSQLQVVIPGIAEALIATAFGLAAAIPAVMAYNYFVRRIRVLESEVDSFSNDYLNIVRRYFLRG